VSTKAQHVDVWLSTPTCSEAGEMYAKFVLDYMRKPAWFQIGASRWMRAFPLFCTYAGSRWRVTGASRLGDVWLAHDPTREVGHDLRVGVTDCSEWGNRWIL
jgi:hypothetical protein